MSIIIKVYWIVLIINTSQPTIEQNSKLTFKFLREGIVLNIQMVPENPNLKINVALFETCRY
jgi:hypothetical protein